MSGAWDVFYDVRTSIQPLIVPAIFVIVWLGAPFVIFFANRRAISKRRASSLFVAIWGIFWFGVGGFGLGNVWYQHLHCVSELESGRCQVVEGPVTQFQPEQGKKRERLTVGGRTFEYYSANLGGGGLRSTDGANGLLHVGAVVRITYDNDNEILRLEIQNRN